MSVVNRKHAFAVLPLLILLLSSLSPLLLTMGVEAEDDATVVDAWGTRPAQLVDGLPPLLCESGTPCDIPARMPTVPVGATSAESSQWWFSFGPDVDANGFDDRLQDVLAGNGSSPSPTAILAPDGRMTVALVIDYAWHPEVAEKSALETVLRSHGWVGADGDAKLFTVSNLDSVIVDKVPQSALLELWRMPGVVVVEMQDVIEPFLDFAAPATLSRQSSTYAHSAHAYGYDGDGVVIAVVDSGVDNEHRSLNDFDDEDDDPDLVPTSYTDQKWVAGYDATSLTSNVDGSDDPDDTAGHGTHVSGIAMGTGDARRQYTGMAPGAYLVDLKVFTDVGRANSADVIRGIEWAINNRDTNWGNNDSSNGIDVMSMSFGTASAPGAADRGDNGTTAQSRAVNDVSDSGIVPVCAMGNDGTNRVPSPASADGCIAVAALHEQNTVDRGDDTVADYSNHGPRLDDDDDDEWDELKPDVIAPGSHIFSAQHAASPVIVPGQPRPMADDSYIDFDGTSMSTPAVAGIVAILLEAVPNLTPEEVKQMLREHSEFRGTIDEDPGLPWNDHYGFGMIDAVSLLEGAGVLGSTGGQTNNTTVDPDYGAGNWVELESPTNDSWFNAEQIYRIRGTAEIPEYDGAPERTIEDVYVRASVRYYDPAFHNDTIIDWTLAIGTDEWWFDLPVELWHDGADVFIEARAKDDISRWSNSSWQWHHVGETVIDLEEPSGYGSLSGDATVKGTYKAVYGERIEYRIGNGQWSTAENLSQGDDYDTGDWQTTWDTTEVADGTWRISVRLVTESGWTTQEVRRNVEVDNQPPAPDLEPFSSLLIEENGISLDRAYVNSYLKVHLDIRNSGDMNAYEVMILLREDGEQATVETISHIDSTDIVSVSLGYIPTTAGDHTLEVVIDPSNLIDESDESNNVISITFPVDPRPPGVDLAFRSGAVATDPEVPNPNGETQMTIRLDNLGADLALQATMSLNHWTDLGWEVIDTRTLDLVPGAGFVEVPFTFHATELKAGMEKFRVEVTVDGDQIDLDTSDNQLEFTLLVDPSRLQGARRPDLPSGHVPLEFYAAEGESLLFTSDGSSVWVHRVNERYDLFTCLELEDEWSGSFALAATDDDKMHIAWTRRFVDDFGLTLHTVSFTTIDSSCTITEIIDLMTPLSLAEGKYWGLDMDIRSDTVAVAGYHRDLATMGTYDDITSVFLLDSDTPAETEGWRLSREIIPVVEVIETAADPVQISLGSELVHILFQDARNDTTGIERLGVFYAHGNFGEQNWAFRKAMGDDAGGAQLAVLEGDDGEDIVVTGWRELDGYDAELVLSVTYSNLTEIASERVAAAGLLSLRFADTSRGLQVFHDAVGPASRQIHYSLITVKDGEAEIALGGPLTEGWLSLASRSDDAGETHIIYTSSSLEWRARLLVDDREPELQKTSILDRLRTLMNLDERTFQLVTKILMATCIMATVLLLAVSAGMMGRRRREEVLVAVLEDFDDPIAIEDDEDAELIHEEIDDDAEEKSESEQEPEPELKVTIEDLPPPPSEEEDEPEDAGTARRKRRKERASKEAEAEMDSGPEGLPPPPSPADMDDLPPPPSPADIDDLPPPPSPTDMGLPPLGDLPPPPPPDREVTCPECGGKFTVKSMELKKVDCPVCDEHIEL